MKTVQKKTDSCIVGIDYFRVSYPHGSGSVGDYLHAGYSAVSATQLGRVVSILEKFSYLGWQASPPHHGYRYAMQDSTKGITVYTNNSGTEDDSGILVQAAGMACGALGAVMTRSLIEGLYCCMGGWLTRIDINVDFIDGIASGLINQAGRSYHKGYFGKIESFEPFLKFKGKGINKVCVNHGCGIGDRSSDKYIRIYDKGLESGEKLKGDHVRWETELKGHKAREFGQEFIIRNFKGLVESEELSSFLASYALGEGRCSKRLASGKYGNVRWYADLLRIAQASVLTIPTRKAPPEYGKKVKWYISVVAPWLKAVGSECDQSAGTVLDSFSIRGRAKLSDLDDPVFAMGVTKFREYLLEVGGSF